MSWSLVALIIVALLFASLVAVLIFAAYLQRLETLDRASRRYGNTTPQNRNTETKEH